MTLSTFASVNPATGETEAAFDPLSDDELTTMLAQASVASRAWAARPVHDRAASLDRLAALYRGHADQLAQLTAREMGKPIAQALAEVELSASIYDYYARYAERLLEDEVLEIAGQGRAVVRTAPIGCVLGIMPWNFPYYQVARFVAPNLLLGNTIVLKHAPNCPQQALLMAELAARAGMPAGVFQNAFATHDQVAAMIADPVVRGVSLTGSDRAGRIIGELAGRNLKKCVLELGGSDPFIVLSDADPAAAARAAAAGRFNNAGQVCTSSKRIIVEDAVFDDFFGVFLDEARHWNLGDPLRADTRLGPLASVDARNTLEAQVQDAVDHGAAVHLGGAAPAGPGSWYPATVLSGITPAMRAYHEELFGPVAMVYRVGSPEEAIRLANDTPYGLGGAVFSADASVAAAIADELEAGMVGVNTTIRSAPDLPFGGVKNSGVGRELARFGIEEFANKKLIRYA